MRWRTRLRAHIGDVVLGCALVVLALVLAGAILAIGQNQQRIVHIEQEIRGIPGATGPPGPAGPPGATALLPPTPQATVPPSSGATRRPSPSGAPTPTSSPTASPRPSPSPSPTPTPIVCVLGICR